MGSFGEELNRFALLCLFTYLGSITLFRRDCVTLTRIHRAKYFVFVIITIVVCTWLFKLIDITHEILTIVVWFAFHLQITSVSRILFLIFVFNVLKT